MKTTALAMAITDSELSDEEASILESGGFSVSRATTPQLTDLSEGKRLHVSQSHLMLGPHRIRFFRVSPLWSQLVFITGRSCLVNADVLFPLFMPQLQKQQAINLVIFFDRSTNRWSYWYNALFIIFG